jgi:hypothetical protein
MADTDASQEAPPDALGILAEYPVSWEIEQIYALHAKFMAFAEKGFAQTLAEEPHSFARLERYKDRKRAKEFPVGLRVGNNALLFAVHYPYDPARLEVDAVWRVRNLLRAIRDAAGGHQVVLWACPYVFVIRAGRPGLFDVHVLFVLYVADLKIKFLGL